jgi:hypothetical protein
MGKTGIIIARGGVVSMMAFIEATVWVCPVETFLGLWKTVDLRESAGSIIVGIIKYRENFP